MASKYVNNMNKRAFLFALITFISVFLLFWILDSKLYQANVHYQKGLVNMTVQQNITLKNVFGKTKDLIANNITADSFSLTKKGYVMLFLLHAGLAILIYVRFHFDAIRKSILLEERKAKQEDTQMQQSE
jgi:hypothetical protein